MVPLITGCCATPSGLVVLCDYRNLKIKLLDERLNFKVDGSCKHSAFDVASTDHDTVFVSIPEEHVIKFVTLKPGLKVEDKQITLKHDGYDMEGYSIAVHDKEHFHLCETTTVCL